MGTYFHVNLRGGFKICFISPFVWFLQRIALNKVGWPLTCKIILRKRVKGIRFPSYDRIRCNCYHFQEDFEIGPTVLNPPQLVVIGDECTLRSTDEGTSQISVIIKCIVCRSRSINIGCTTPRLLWSIIRFWLSIPNSLVLGSKVFCMIAVRVAFTPPLRISNFGLILMHIVPGVF